MLAPVLWKYLVFFTFIVISFNVWAADKLLSGQDEERIELDDLSIITSADLLSPSSNSNEPILKDTPESLVSNDHEPVPTSQRHQGLQEEPLPPWNALHCLGCLGMMAFPIIYLVLVALKTFHIINI